jgi:KUP system potassium uptake protein
VPDPSRSHEDAARPAHRTSPAATPHAGRVALTLGALGVVFGDIGTSPLYALHTVFGDEGVDPSRTAIYGVISLVVWSVTIVVSLKYVTFVMRADNEGEGGIMALIALIQGTRFDSRRASMVLVALGIFGASLFYGDGMITPAISVLSAVEGMKVVTPSFDELVVPVTLAIIVGLFSIQHFGTGAVGRLFGPVMGLWFGLLALGGIGHIAEHPGILRALSPTYAVEFFADHPGIAFVALGGVVLTITGAEALYADMGHFGRGPIRRAWFAVVFPALMLNYMGQGSLILGSAKTIDNPFFLLYPHWARIPMVLVATLATVIASQAVISGAFSVTRQAVQLGFLPRLTIRQTSREEVGQVYVPVVNWGIFIAVVALVIGFGSSARLASAYGIAVTGTLAIDTLLFFVVVRQRWRRPVRLVAFGLISFLSVDLLFFAANVSKIPHGGWFPLAIAAIVFSVLITWERGRVLVTVKRTGVEGPLREFIRQLHDREHPVVRVPGTAVFMHANNETTPLAMRANIEHNHTLHESVVIFSVDVLRVPHVHDEDRITVDELGFGDDGITHVRARYGFSDELDVPAALKAADALGLERPIDVDGASYFLSRLTIVPKRNDAMAMWRKKLFVTLSRNASSAPDYFALPVDRVVTTGSQIEL